MKEKIIINRISSKNFLNYLDGMQVPVNKITWKAFQMQGGTIKKVQEMIELYTWCGK